MIIKLKILIKKKHNNKNEERINVIKNDLISVIIPTYNREKTILRAVQSVLDQTYQNFEIIIVDDCSSDKTVKIIKPLLEKDMRIKLLLNEKNQGPNYSRNRGIKNSKGEYIALLDSDDEWLSEKLENQLQKFKNNSENVGLVYCGVAIINVLNKSKEIISPKYRGNVLKNLSIRNIITGGGSGSLIKRKVFEKCGFFDEHESLRRGGSQDYEMWIRISQYFEFEYVNDVLLNVYLYNDCITYITSVKNLINKIKAILHIWGKYKKFFQEIPDAYISHCYRLFISLNLLKNKKMSRKVIFMALKKKMFRIRTYYYLIYYLHNYYSIYDIISKLARIKSLSYVSKFIYRPV